MKSKGVSLIPRSAPACQLLDSHLSCSGDFTLYDHVLDHSLAFNAVPRRYLGHGLSELDLAFAMARGRQTGAVDVPACEMSKWSVLRASPFCLLTLC